MANLRILTRNIADTAVITASPAMSSTLPVTNLGKPTERARTARTTSLASQDIKLAWASAQKANMIALPRHNLTTAATLRTLGYSDSAWTTGILDTTALTAFSTSGLNTDIDVHTERDFQHLKSSAQYFAEQTTMQSLIARIADAANPDGYMEANRLMIGKYFEVTYNPGHGVPDLTLMDASVMARADDGTQVVDKRWKGRRLVLNLDWIPDTDVDDLLALARYLGTDKETWVSLYPGAGGALELYNQMACRLVDSPTFNPHQYGLHRNTMTFEEV